MAPHHGSRAANTLALAEWAKPRAVVSSQGRPRGLGSAGVYEAIGADVFTTDEDGAVAIALRGDRLAVETFRAGKSISLRAVVR
jgi:beta-lactamase superfamily II metal-dependent hydrolase